MFQLLLLYCCWIFSKFAKLIQFTDRETATTRNPYCLVGKLQTQFLFLCCHKNPRCLHFRAAHKENVSSLTTLRAGFRFFFGFNKHDSLKKTVTFQKTRRFMNILATSMIFQLPLKQFFFS